MRPDAFPGHRNRFDVSPRVGWRALMISFLFMALFAPLLAPYNPAALDLVHRLAAPDSTIGSGPTNWARHPLACDLGGSAVTNRGRLGGKGSRSCSDLFLAVSLLLRALARCDHHTFLMNGVSRVARDSARIAFVAFLGPGLLNLILALSIGGWVGYARLVRAQVLPCASGVCRSRPRRRGQRFSHLHAAYFAEHPAATHRAGGHRHGGSGAGRSDYELSGPRRSAPGGELGIDAQRCAPVSIRRAASVVFPAIAVIAVRALVQFSRRRAGAIPRSRTRIAVGL